MDIREFISICKKDRDIMIFFDKDYEIDKSIKPYFVPNNLPHKICEYDLLNDEPTFYLTINQGGVVYLNSDVSDDPTYLTNRFFRYKVFDKAKSLHDYLILSLNDDTRDTFLRIGAKLEDLNIKEDNSDSKNFVKFYKFYTSNINFDSFFFQDVELSSKDYCLKSYELLKAKGERKIINSLIERLENKPKNDTCKILLEVYDEKYVEILKNNYISDNGFNPRSSKSYHKVPILEVKIKNLSSLPSLKELEEKISKGKLNDGANLLLECYNNNKDLPLDLLYENYDFIDNYIKIREEDLRNTKYCLYLTDKVFKEFTDRSTQNELLYDDKEFSLIYNLQS